MTTIKICGLQPGDDLSFTSHPSVSVVGLVFVKGSRRYVPPTAAHDMVASVAPDCGVMGIFVNDKPEHLLQIAREVGLAGLQLHGDESVETCRQLRNEGFIVWKALSVPRGQGTPVGLESRGSENRDVSRANHPTENGDDTLSHLSLQLERYAPYVDGILLDAPPPTQTSVASQDPVVKSLVGQQPQKRGEPDDFGGTGNSCGTGGFGVTGSFGGHGNLGEPDDFGVTGGFGVSFDWSRLPQLLNDRAMDTLPPVWVAGGIRPENVAALFSWWVPYGVDVSSGVEVEGRKSTLRIQQLIEAVETHG